MSASVIQSGFAIGSSFVFPSDNILHNAIIAVLSIDAGVASIEISDTQGNVYTALPIRFNKATGASLSSQIFYCLDIKAGANTISGTAFDTGHVSQGPTDIMVCEVSVIKFKEADANAFGVGLVQNSGNISIGATESFLFGHEAAPNLGNGQASVIAGAGFTQIENILKGLIQFKIVTPGTYSSDTTSTVAKSGVCFWLEDVVSFTDVLPPAGVPNNSIITF